MYDSGASTLTDQELLSLILGDPGAAYEVIQYTRGSLKVMSSMYLSELAKLPKMTVRKASVVAAFFEVNRRRNSENIERAHMQTSSDVINFLSDKLSDLQHEAFMVMFLNRSNRVNHYEIVSSGGITGTVADPRLILKKALDYRAVALVLAHNHPSGSLRPSRQDEELTVKIKEAAKYFDIKILDHVIVSQEGYYSFADEGIL